MADKRIQDLTPASSVGTADRFVLEQSGQAKSLTGQVLINDLATALDGHGGIASITYTAPVSPSLAGTLTITLADESVVTLSITNGRGITGISKSSSGLTDTYTLSYNDGTTSTFSVDNGKEISSVLKTGAVGLTDIYTISYNDNTTDSFNVTNGRGIDNISWSESGTQGDGMTHTGTISYNDNTTSTIIFHDGVKGDTGAQTYVWFKWAQNYPTQDSDMQNSVAPYIGIYSGLSSTAPTDYTAYAWYQYKGDKGDTGDTGDYIDPVVSFGTSTAAATEPQTWYNSPSSISYAAGNFIWQKTQYTLHNAQTVQSTEKKIIGYIGQNGSGSGTVTQITFNGTAFQDDGTGNVPMTVDAADVGAIADPIAKANGQVLTYDSSADEWVAATPTTGDVNTVNNVGVTAGTTNIQLYGTAIPMSSTDNTSVKDAIPLASSSTPQPLGTAAVGTGTTWARADHVHQLPTLTEFGGVRPNLLKNWYFVGGGSQQGWGYFPINSNGQTSYSGTGVAIDGWQKDSLASLQVQANGVAFNGSGATSNAFQTLTSKVIYGKTVTASALETSGTLSVGTTTVPTKPSSGWSYKNIIAGSTYNLVFGVAADGTIRFFIQPKNSASIVLTAVKLELGSEQTLAHQENGSWVLNELPQFDDEYARSTGLVYTIPRPNLLDNWYFVGGGSQQGAGYFPINQKGQTSYSIPAARTNCIDRWFGYDGQGSGSIQIVSGGVKLTKSTNADGIYFGQSGVYEDLTGKTVTLSILTSTGALYSGTATVPQSNIISAYPNFAAGVTIESGKVLVQFYSYASSVTVVAVKLELGDSQTLAHQVNGSWVLNEVPNYADELTKIEKADSKYASNYAHITGNSAHTIYLSNPYQSFIIQHAHIALSLVVAQSGSTPLISDVYGTHTFTMTASGNALVFTGGSSGAQYNLYSGESFYMN